MQLDFFTIGLLALVAVMIFFMFRSSRRRRREAEEMQAKLLPGAEIMTQHGIYGTLVSVDEEKNEAIVETTPGTRLRLHRQVIARVVDPTLPEPEENDAELETLEESGTIVGDEPPLTDEPTAGEPRFGERIDDDKPKPSGSREKPTE
jgi:preprotein translocase subunit YajC